MDKKKHTSVIIAAAFAVSLITMSACGSKNAQYDFSQKSTRETRQPGGSLIKGEQVVKEDYGNYRFSIDEEGSQETSAKSAGKTAPESNPLPQPADPAAKREPVKVFEVGNGMAVYNGGKPPSFTIDKPCLLTELWTYHHNDGQGAPPGTIALKKMDGTIYGPWQASLKNRFYENNKIYWIATPDISLEPGTYTVIDSDPSTFSQNEENGGMGMAWGYGFPE